MHPCRTCGKMTIRQGNCFRHRNRSSKVELNLEETV
jgi:hypothetical protein